MKKFTKYLITFSVLIIISLGFFLRFRQQENFHIHAGFKIYLNNILQDYSLDKYMSIEACSTNEENNDEVATHLHNGVGDIVHVHKKNTTWRMFLDNIGFDYNKNPIVAVLNGENIGDILDREIHDLDSIVIVSGEYKDFEQMANSAVSKDKIIEVANSKENCGK